MIGKALRERRQVKGWTQSYVGEQVGITSVSVHDIEIGKNRPFYNVLLKLCKLFSIEHGEVKGPFDAIRFMEHSIENIISIEVDKGTHYKDVYQVCKAKCQILKELSFLPSLLEAG